MPDWARGRHRRRARRTCDREELCCSSRLRGHEQFPSEFSDFRKSRPGYATLQSGERLSQSENHTRDMTALSEEFMILDEKSRFRDPVPSMSAGNNGKEVRSDREA